jgi:hypothetical protein
MQAKPPQITANFAPETQFDVETKSAEWTFDIPELVSLPVEEQLIYVSPNLLNSRGIPFSPIHD